MLGINICISDHFKFRLFSEPEMNIKITPSLKNIKPEHNSDPTDTLKALTFKYEVESWNPIQTIQLPV